MAKRKQVDRDPSDEVLRLSERITLVPVVHGSGDMAVAVRRLLLDRPCDLLAVPIPPSFQEAVEVAIRFLPTVGMALQREPKRWPGADEGWRPEADAEDSEATEGVDDESAGGDEDAEGEGSGRPRASYVPIDPCQPVIAALRTAGGERIPRAFIDLEVERFQTYSAVLPDPYALKRVSLAQYAAAVLPAVPRPPHLQAQARVAHMAARLLELEKTYRSIVAVVSILDWPWIREAYRKLSGAPLSLPAPASPEQNLADVEALSAADRGQEHVAEALAAAAAMESPDPEPVESFRPTPKTTIFMLGELPYITGLYETARADLEDDENLSVDGVKELLVTARDRYKAEFQGRARKISPLLLRQMLKYVRNLCLIERRLTPDLYTLVIAAKQIAGDQYARHVAETAREYVHAQGWGNAPEVALGIEKARLPDGDVVDLVSRLPGPPTTWRKCELVRRPEKTEKRRWEMSWNPYSQCSWPPEDEKIENFRSTVMDRAKAVMGLDLARTEKFTTSLRDGLDIRETLRNWHTGDLFVKIQPPSRGRLDCVVMLFDHPADPKEYTWRTTWFAEHDNESTLAFYATDFRNQLIGPGIALATYGGAMFLYPPRHIHCIWRDPEFDAADTMEDRLIMAACRHSESRHVVLLSPQAPGLEWRKIATRYGKKLVHLPNSMFSSSTIAQLRLVHVLNGREVRSYAADFIRKA